MPVMPGGARLAKESPYATLLVALIVVLLPLTLAATLASIYRENMIFLAIGFGALYTVLVPIVILKQYDLGSPLTMIIFPIAVGLTIRNIYIGFRIKGLHSIDSLFLLGERPSYFVWPGILLIIGLATIVISYSLFRPRTPYVKTLAGRLERYTFDRTRLFLVLTACVVVAIVTFVLYVRATGGFDADRLSAKRATIPSLELSLDYRGFGYLVFANEFGATAFLVALAYFLKNQRSLWGWRGAVLVGMFVVAVALPVYASSRTPVIMLLLLAGAIRHFTGRPVRMRSLVVGASVVLVAFGSLTFARAQSQGTFTETIASITLDGGLEALIFDRNMLELSKTAHVINRVPSELPYAYGATIATYLFAPVPRELWPAKPLVSPGPVIGNVVYGNKVSGVPPGVIAELFWNFGVAGVLVGCALIGMLVRYLYEKCRPGRGVNVAAILIYVVGVFRLGLDLVGTSVGTGLFLAMTGVAHVSVVLLLVGRIPRDSGRREPRPPEAVIRARESQTPAAAQAPS